MAKSLEKVCRKYFQSAGIEINGNNPWDIHVNNPNFYSRVLAGGSLALGETYIEGMWDCQRIDEFIEKIIKSNLSKKARIHLSAKTITYLGIKKIEALLKNIQDIKKSRKVGEIHYDLGNDLYELMLDPYMQYSCGYWKNAETLKKAQEDKLELSCKKVKLKDGMSLLDIGCGWGGLLKYTSQKYKIKRGLGVSISKEQIKYSKTILKPYPQIEIRDQDYRKISEKFDAIISIGMFEHVGRKNYRKYFKKVEECLNDNGLFLLQTIVSLKPYGGTDPWLNKYIFPGGVLPSIKQIKKKSYNILKIKDMHNFGDYYDKTLIAWNKNFQENWPKIQENNKYDLRFKRMWEYYLLSCAGAFRSGKIQIWQIVFSKAGQNINYQSVR